jgi:hypothetical protein
MSTSFFLWLLSSGEYQKRHVSQNDRGELLFANKKRVNINRSSLSYHSILTIPKLATKILEKGTNLFGFSPRNWKAEFGAGPRRGTRTVQY